jgi:LacI family transcriptional regulator
MKHVTLADVSREAGLTKSAASLALRSDPRIPVGTRRRVEKAARKLGYKRNATVSHLMAELRRGTAAGSRATIALLNVNDDPRAFTRHPTIPSYVQGVKERAGDLGYAVDTINESAVTLGGRRLRQILQTRGIRGCVLTGLMRSNRLPRHLDSLWKRFPCVVTGVRTVDPQLPFACSDHFAVSEMAMAMALRSGCQRPALVLDRQIDELVQGRFTAGFLIAQREISAARRIPPYYHGDNEPEVPPEFVQWFRRYNPDAIMTLYHVVEDWLRMLGIRPPSNVALIQLERRPHVSSWAGVDQHNDRTGAAAVDLLVQMIHAGETALATHSRAILIEPSWRPGETLTKVRC